MKVQKKKSWMKRQGAVSLSAMLVASSFFGVIGPSKVEAADPVGPGGVGTDLISWVDMEKSYIPGDGDNGTYITKLQDLADTSRHWKNYDTGQRVQQLTKYGTKMINYHYVTVPNTHNVQFNTTTLLPDPSGAREVFSVQSTGSGPGGPWEFGGKNATVDKITYTDSSINTGFGSTTTKKFTPSQKVSIPHILNTWSGTNDWSLSLNGKQEKEDHVNTVNWSTELGNSQGYHYIGASQQARFDGGNIAETLVFNRKLNDLERTQVNSYLALKYGVTLKGATGTSTDYVTSDGSTKMWTAANNTGYGYRITGIGRDADGGLDQKQSKSVEANANVAIALGNAISLANKDNTNTIANDKSFFTFSDDNASSDYETSTIEEPGTNKILKKMKRIFKVEEIDWTAGSVTLKLDVTEDSTAPVHNYYLLTSTDGVTFNQPTVANKLNVDYETTINSSELKFFTFAKVHKEDLKSLLDGIPARNLEEAIYTPESWTIFATAKTKAETVLGNPDATQEKVDEARTELDAAITGLVLVSVVPPVSVKNPGGVGTNLSLWLKANDGATADGANRLTGWDDKTGTNNFTVHGTPALTANGVNFNPVVKITGNTGNKEWAATRLVGNTTITYADAYAVFNNPNGVIVGSTVVGANYGPAVFSKEGATFYAAGNGANSTYTTFAFPAGIAQPRMANSDIGGSAHTARLDGVNQPFTRTATFGSLPFTPVIASTISAGNGSNYLNFNGDIAEVILYAGSTASDRAKIETYLAVKYGITLNNGESNYVDTAGNSVWTVDNTYKKNIAGIGRDDAEALLQKQSRSVNTGTQLAIGLTELKETNVLNTGTLTDKQYLIWGDNGKALTFNKPIIDTTEKYHAERVWKVQNTGTVGQVQIAIPTDKVPADTTLLVSDTTNFNIVQEHSLNTTTLNGVAHYAAKVTLTDGQFFTFAAPAPKPESVTLEQSITDGNKIVLTFDKDIALTDLTGFTVKVGNDVITIGTGGYVVVGKTLTLTLPTGTDLSGDKAVTVSYDKSTGNLKGTNGVPVNNFTQTATDDFGASLKITEPSGTTVNVPKPVIKGEVEVGATPVTVVIKDKDGVVPNAGGNATVDTNGNWTFTPAENLPPGTYTIEVTATKDGKSATKTKEFTIVDKTALQTKVTDVAGLTETDYTPASWIAFKDAKTAAETVLNNPNATQTEVDDALTALNTAHTNLVPATSAVDKTALQTKVTDVTGLTETDYTPASWITFKDAKIAAETVLNNPNATQKEVDDALTALTTAHTILVPASSSVDKSLLQARVDVVNGLTEADYTSASWAALQPGLADALTVLGNPNATQQQINDAYTALVAVHDALVPITTGVNKSALEGKLTEVGGLTGTNYTPDSWNALKDAEAIAQGVFDDPNATQQQVNYAVTKLQQAQTALVPAAPVVDKSSLLNKVNEVTGLTGSNYTSASWNALITAKTAAETVLNNPNATQKEVDDALTALQTVQNLLVPVTQNTGGQLSSLVPSTGNLYPTFSSGTTSYSMNVGYGTTSIGFIPTALDPSATIEMSVNGQPITNGNFPLNVGTNTIIVKVTDATGTKTYVVTVYRASDSNTGNNNGGGSVTPTPTPTPTPVGPTKEIILVDLVIDGKNPIEKTPVRIERTRETNGEVTDRVALTPDNARDAVNKAKAIGNSIARIVIPDVRDEVSKVTVEVRKQAISILRAGGIDLEIYTDNVLLTIPQTSMEGIEDDFYFRLVPIKEESKRKEIEVRAKAEKVVRDVMQNDHIDVVARPITIETNLSSRPVTITLPLRDVKIPTDPAEREAFLKQLAVFIEHTDGEKKVVFGEVVTMPNNELGLRISVTKFSTFTIINVGKKEELVQTHQAYIKGFQDGTFKPNQDVTRKQIALMIARNLGYVDGDNVEQAPFKDVAVDSDGAGAIAYLKQLGIMNGDENGNFLGSDKMTRAQMAAVVANYKKLVIKEVPATFTDTKNHWAKNHIEANLEADIITGFEDGTFKPKNNLTRAHAVKMINRMFDRGPLHGLTELGFSDVAKQHWAFEEIAEAAQTHHYTLDDLKKEWVAK